MQVSFELQFLRKQPKAAYLRNKKGGLYGKIHALAGRQDHFRVSDQVAVIVNNRKGYRTESFSSSPQFGLFRVISRVS